MEKELVINSGPNEVEVALLENGKLVEIHSQKKSLSFAVGDIFLGVVKKNLPSLNASFVDVGTRKDAFLHYTDLGPQIKSLIKYTEQVHQKKHNSPWLDQFQTEPDNSKNGKIDQVFPKNAHVLVQVLKEPISTKGPRLSCEITIPGRYMVITPFSDTVAVSKKIGSAEERSRLKLLVDSIKPKKFGVIVRTAAEGKKVADLHAEIKELSDKWEEIYNELRSASGPGKLLSELDKTTSIIRDILNESFTKISVNDRDMYEGIKDYMETVAPDKVDIVTLYKGSRPIFETFGVARQIKASFGKTSTMNSGAYIVIEHTEAMHVIDVNSGPKMQKRDQEDSSLNVNKEAAEEIARQLRLRDIGGIIIIDFIDMKNPENKVALFNAMRDYMKNDRAQHTILPLSKFGLMQITRQRVRPEIKIDTTESCAVCGGTGKTLPSVLATDNIERDLNYILQTNGDTKLTLVTHPYVKAFLTQGFPSIQMRWWLKYRKWIKVNSNYDYDLFKYTFIDGNQDEIRLA